MSTSGHPLLKSFWITYNNKSTLKICSILPTSLFRLMAMLLYKQKTNMINSSDSPFKFKNEVACESCLSFLMKWQLGWETLIPRQCHGCLKSGQHLQLDKTFTRQKPINGYFTRKIVLFSFQKNRVWFLITLFQTNESTEKLQHYVIFGFFSPVRASL